MSAARSAARLCVVGGEAPIRNFIAAYLADAGFSVATAAGARAALALARGEPPDLVLLDASIPGRDDPYVACRQLSSAVPSGLPVVVLVAGGCRGAALLAADCGVVDYVVKPFEPVELKARIQAALRTKSALDHLHALQTSARPPAAGWPAAEA